MPVQYHVQCTCTCNYNCTHLSSTALHTFLKYNHCQSKQCHNETMSSITKHDSKEKWKCNDCVQSYRERKKDDRYYRIRYMYCTCMGVVIKPRPLIDRAPQNDETSLLHIQHILVQVTETIYIYTVYIYI